MYVASGKRSYYTNADLIWTSVSLPKLYMKTLKSSVERIGVIKPHIIFWLLFIIYEIAFSYSATGAFSHVVDYFTFYILNISLFYLHAYIILKNSDQDKFPISYIITYAVIEIIGYLSLKYLITIFYLWLGIYKIPNPPLLSYIRNSSWRAIYFIGLASAYGYSKLAIRSRRKINALDKQHFADQLREQQLEQNLLAYENAFLKAQINPHFLFNMLNLIHNRVAKHSESAGDLIVSISELMRYALMEIPSDGKVELIQEIEHIENYIMLNRHRYSQQLYLVFHIRGEVDKVKIIPLVLLTLVENVVKYGDLWNSSNHASISLTLSENRLEFKINNTKIKRLEVASNGIGMSNIIRRLDQFYPGNYELLIDQDDFNYQLVLTLTIPSNDLLYN